MVHALTLPAHSELEKTERGPFSGMAAYLWSRNTDIQEFRNVRPFHRSTGTLRFFIRPKSKPASDGIAEPTRSTEPSERALTAFNGNRRVPPPVNEPVKSYAPGSPERAALKDRLKSMAGERVDIPLIIGGEEVHTGELVDSVMPHNHRHVLGQWHRADETHIDRAVRAAAAAAKDWANWPWEDRAG